MTIYERTVHLADTDATGFLFFTAQQVFVVEVVEKILSIKNLLKKSYALPIVMAHSLYKRPLTVGDVVYISISLKEVKEKSFTWYAVLKDPQGEIVGEVTITHVAIDRQSRQTIPLPAEVGEKIHSLGTL